MNNDPNSFSYRLRGSIAMLEAETQQGVEDWTSTIARLKTTLAEVEKEEAQASQELSAATASYSDALDSDDEYDLEAFD